MGPLVPHIISPELNLIVALFMGIAFGFILEQAGFSSSRKLAGLFYGYDFTVLRVFFTAGVTAMSGIILLSYFGLIDTEIIYVNPTWLWPAIVGGCIMGVGFVVGGYCPGTSVCAMAIGKVDAMYFVGGGLLGIFVFGEFYPSFAAFYGSTYLGPLKVYDSLGLSQGVFALLLIVVAMGAFVFTSWLEKRNSAEAPARDFPVTTHRIAAGALAALGILLLFAVNHKDRLIAQVSSADYIAEHPIDVVAADELAFMLVDDHAHTQLRIIDVRPAEEFKELALPRSSNAEPRELFGQEWQQLLGRRGVQKVIVADDESQARATGLLLKRLGYENIKVLEGGMGNFRDTILSPEGFVPTGSRWDQDVREFREMARTELARMIEEQKNAKPDMKPKKRKIQGGC